MVDGIYRMDSQLAGELITAINGLTALQLLALHYYNTSQVPDLSIFAQLKTVVFKRRAPEEEGEVIVLGLIFRSHSRHHCTPPVFSLSN